MDTFWQLLRESIIVQSTITLMLVSACVYMWVTGRPVPDNLFQLTNLIVGFWVGTKATATIMAQRSAPHDQ